MRLNLPKYECIYFRIRGEVAVSNDRDVEIQAFMDQTEGHDHEEDSTRIAFFGSRSRMGDTTHQIQGSIFRLRGTEDSQAFRLSIASRRMRDTLSRPPATMKPVSKLIEVAPRLFGPISVTCSTAFEYAHAQDYRSKVRFPIPLVIQGDSVGVTHIEQAQFSRKVDDDVEYKISISQDSESFKHSIEFEATIILERKSIRSLLDQSRAISLHFVNR